MVLRSSQRCLTWSGTPPWQRRGGFRLGWRLGGGFGLATQAVLMILALGAVAQVTTGRGAMTRRAGVPPVAAGAVGVARSTRSREGQQHHQDEPHPSPMSAHGPSRKRPRVMAPATASPARMRGY